MKFTTKDSLFVGAWTLGVAALVVIAIGALLRIGWSLF